MTNPQQKANELIEKFKAEIGQNLAEIYTEELEYLTSVQCAIIAVEEIIASQPKTVSAIGFGSAQVTNPDIQFWKEVLNELKEKL